MVIKGMVESQAKKGTVEHKEEEAKAFHTQLQNSL
jgi:hypothetical protein